LDGEPFIWEQTEQVAREWTRHANIQLEFGRDAAAEIRLSFAHPGWWSKIGREALDVTDGSPTMNIGDVDPAADLRRFRQAVLHEFGHVLGCVHEHQSPASGITWNEEAVVAYFAVNYGWSRERTREMVIERFTAGEITQFTEFDPDSVMLYPIPPEFTHGSFSSGVNSALSRMDRDFIASIYP
jgi:serralysin